MKKIKKSTITDFILSVVLMLFVFIAFLISWGPLEKLEYGIHDLNTNLRVKKSTAPVVVVAIDEQSIANIGRWPWPRAYIASMIDLLQSYNVKVIGLDIIYSGKDSNQGLLEVRNLINNMESNPDYAQKGFSSVLVLLKETEIKLDNDALLTNAIAAGKKVDGRSDLFSLGVVLYEMIAGEKPFQGESITTLMYNITSSVPPSLKGISPQIPGKMVPIVEKLLAKDMKDRYQTGKSLADDLLACLSKEA